MVRLQRLTGMAREVCQVRGRRRRTTAEWLYTPASHKTEHGRGGSSSVPGPGGPPYLNREPEAYCFSGPAEATRNAERSKRRVTPLWDSHRRRNGRKRKTRRQRPPGGAYTPESYAQAIDRACVRAYPPLAPLTRRAGETVRQWKERLGPEGVAQVEQWPKAHRFHPNQVRHRAAAAIRAKFGIETCRAVLGHSFAAMSDHYAKDADCELGRMAAAEIG